jgi:RNA polymerase sigma factor for flagellar operon FliA
MNDTDATLATSVIDELWTRVKAGEDEAAREGLILHYSALVKFVAGRVGSGLPRTVDQNDLVSYGVFGLIDAIDKFEPERGFKFETYAIPRIRGAILDELRALDWVPRSVRSRAREIERTITELEHKLGRSPTDEEIAASMEVPVDQLRDHLGEISNSGFIALDESPGPAGEGRRRSANAFPTPGASVPRRRSPTWRTSGFSPTPSTDCPSGTGSCSPSTTTRASRWRRSVPCSASPNRGCARSTRSPS